MTTNSSYFIDKDPITSAPRLVIFNQEGIVTKRLYLHDAVEEMRPHVKALADAYTQYCNSYGFRKKIRQAFNHFATFALDFIDMALGKERQALPQPLSPKFSIANHQIGINQIFDNTLLSTTEYSPLSDFSYPQEEIIALMHFLRFDKELDQMYKAADTGMETLRSHVEFMAVGHKKAFKKFMC